ncbi:50S ribosomal protein L2 [Candidatus Pacearchaeota archaeon]|nr:50S ribosomal protein L2P [uncultured archaeon]MBS3089438.1 50S ribosomal protein L2 [Candidatus Pacearchaeota archaeon]
MGKRIISQARGHGSLSYQARKRAFIYKIKYPMGEGEAEVLNIIHSAAHSAPLLKVKLGNQIFYNPAFNGAVLGQKINVTGLVADGNVLSIKDIPLGTHIYNIERNPGDGGKMIRAAGLSAVVFKKHEHNKISLLMPNKHEVIVSGDCRATIGIIAGEGRVFKPFIKAGAKFYKMKTRNKLWPRTSAVKMNAVDHPFGSGRGKRIKSKIAKRNAPPGTRVGHLRPRRTGRKR